MPRIRARFALWFSLVAIPMLWVAAQSDPAPAVLESAICLSVQERTASAAVDTLDAGTEQVFCWTRIGGAAGQTITHAWMHGGTTRARVELAVGSDDWRTYSSKRILPSWTGDWEVKVLTPDGAVLASIPFYVR